MRFQSQRKTAFLLLLVIQANAQPRQDPGKSIGKVHPRQSDRHGVDAARSAKPTSSIRGRTLRFILKAGVPRRKRGLQWDSTASRRLAGAQHNFAFSPSGKNWIRPSAARDPSACAPQGARAVARGGGVPSAASIHCRKPHARWSTLSRDSRLFCRACPASLLKELRSAVITWDLTEPSLASRLYW
jgi:hypothetical protein